MLDFKPKQKYSWWCNSCEVGWIGPDTRTGKKCWWCHTINNTVLRNGEDYKNPVQYGNTVGSQSAQAWARIMGALVEYGE